MKKIFFLILISSNIIFTFDKINGICLGLISKKEINENFFLNLKELNIDKLRVSVLWGNIEKEEKIYNWNRLDYIVEQAEKNNIKLLFVVGYFPKWLKKKKFKNENLKFEYYLSKYKYFLKSLVTRYHKRVLYYEIWNEQNLKLYWKFSQKKYLKLLKESYLLIKGINNKLTVLHGGIANNDYEYLNWLIKNIKNYTDIINIHFYYHWKYPKYHKISFIKKTIHLSKTYKKPIWITETGLPTGGYRNSSNQKVGLYAYEQAKELIKLFLILKSTDIDQKIKNIYIYNYKDNKINIKKEGDNFGLLFLHGYKKPSFYSISFLNRKLSSIKKCKIHYISFNKKSFIECSISKNRNFFYIENFKKEKILYQPLNLLKKYNQISFFDMEGINTDKGKIFFIQGEKIK